jgi:hypothetical protein
VATGEEKWEDALTSSTVTPMHLLHPTDFTVKLDKCFISDDPQLPKLKVTGHLPNVAINITGNFFLFVFGVYIKICKIVKFMQCIVDTLTEACQDEDIKLFKEKLCKVNKHFQLV